MPLHPPGARVWDLPLRIFHWLLLGAILCAGVTAWLLPANWLSYHLAAGIAALALVVLRIVWGFTGTHYSRFVSFAYGPGAALAHLNGLLNGHARRETGHNPLGAQMVFALLAGIPVLTVTGGLALGGLLKQGPFKSVIGYDAAAWARELHELAAFGLAGLIAFHIAGVVMESIRTRENLARAMVTGRKRAETHGSSETSARPKLALALSSGLLIAGTAGTLALSKLDALGLPAQTANAAWQTECSACHIAFHPSLLPTASWSTLMAGLPAHFGEDASLPVSTAADITAFLAANSAETADTLPAHVFRRIDPARPLEITAAPFWKRKHADIADAVFASKPIGARQNCAACHGDAATGLFAPQRISIPTETQE